MPPRKRAPLDPGAAEEARRAAAAAKAERAPHLLTEAEVMLLPGAKVLQLGNDGRLQHLGIGTPTKVAAAPKSKAASPERPPLTDAQLTKMSGEAIRKAVAEGRVPGIGARRRTWGQR